jgi:small subunit ribosomal protein S3
LGHKVHPIGYRLGVIKDWQSKWYSDSHYAEFILEDNKIREHIKEKYAEAAISTVEIDRQGKDVTITLHTARPGIVIGRGGQRVDEMRQQLEALIGKKVRLNIQEVRQPELDAYLVARSVAEQIERRVAYRRAMKQAIFRSLQSGAKGIKVSAAGRLANAEIARRQTLMEGQVPLHTLRADIDYGFTEARTTLGRIGVKVWIYKGQVLPELKIAEEEKPAEAAAETAPTSAGEAAKAAPAVEEKPARAPKAAPVGEGKAARAPKAAPPTTSIVGEKLAEAQAAKAKAEKAEKPAAAAKPVAEEKAAKPKARKAAPAKVEEEKEPEVKAAKPKAAAAKKAEPKAAPAAAGEEAEAPRKKARKSETKAEVAPEAAPKAARKAAAKNKEEGKDATA